MPHVHAFCSFPLVHASADVLCPPLPALFRSLFCPVLPCTLYTIRKLLHSLAFPCIQRACFVCFKQATYMHNAATQDLCTTVSTYQHAGICWTAGLSAPFWFQRQLSASSAPAQRQLSHLLSTMPEAQGVPGCLSAAQQSKYQ